MHQVQNAGSKNAEPAFSDPDILSLNFRSCIISVHRQQSAIIYA